MSKRFHHEQPRRFWSEEDYRTLTQLYPHTSTAEIAKLLKRSVQAVYGMAETRGLKKTQAFLNSAEYKSQFHAPVHSRFSKGHEPANKGLRRPGWNRGRMKETQFKKGQRTGAAASAGKNWLGRDTRNHTA
jgi:hypothetical protein